MSSLLAGVLLSAVSQSHAQSTISKACKLNDIVTQYQISSKQFEAKRYNEALIGWAGLAEAGFGPAQRRIALMYDTGIGLEKSAAKAALWAELSFRSGDRSGRRLSRDFLLKVTPEQRKTVRDQLKAWKVRALNCADDRLKGSSQPIKLDYKVTKHKRISAEHVRQIDEMLPVVLRRAIEADASARVYLSAIDEFEFYNGSRYDRYVGWKPKIKLKDKSQNVLVVSVSNFWDQAPDYFAKAITLMAKRRFFDSLSDSKFADPLMRIIGGKKVFGSVYPDIRNGNFFKVMRQAFAMAERLPKSLRFYIDIVDEIHYNPASKLYVRSGTIDSKGAFYIKSLSAEGHRMMFVRRKVLFSSPLFFLQTFIHEGTHAAQDQKAFNDYRESERAKAVLARLQSSGKGKSQEAKRLQNEINVKQDYVNRWYRGVQTDTGRVQDIAFECEATENEIKTVKLIGGDPAIMKASGYLKLCPEAQRQIIQWQDELIQQNRKKNR